MILIKHPDTGETALVESTDGHDDWDVLAEDVDPPPDEDHEWNDRQGRWRPSADRRQMREKVTRARRLLRNPEALLDAIDDLTARVETLEAQLRGE